MKKYFYLNPECYLVKGAVRGAIYDLHSGDVYSLDPLSTSVLDVCEQRKSLADVFQSEKAADEKTIIGYLTLLEEEGLGQFYPQAVYVEKLMPEVTLAQRHFMRIPPSFYYVYIELSNRCNLDCVFCGPQTDLRRSTTGCWRWSSLGNGSLINREEWEDILKAAIQLGCKVVHFVGSEPLLEWNTLTELIALATNQGCEVILTTNGALLDDGDKVDFLVDHKVISLIQMLSANEQTHDLGTRFQESFKNTIHAVQTLQSRKGRYAFTLPVYRDNQHDVENTIHFLESLGPQSITLDVLRPFISNGESPSTNKLTPRLYRTGPHFPKVTASMFFRRREGHQCWNGRLAITTTGDVIPCPAARGWIIGNLSRESLYSIYRHQDYEESWRLGIDTVMVCNKCEYRYACFECNGFGSEKVGVKSKYCTYDPLTGQWNSVGQ